VGTKTCQNTVALLNLVQLGSIVCGGNTQDRSAISGYFSHQILTLLVRYLARLLYTPNHAGVVPIQHTAVYYYADTCKNQP
jgi:hypothetical protein